MIIWQLKYNYNGGVLMKIRKCSDCRYEKEDVSSEVCATCHGLVKGDPSNWKQKGE
mgnify:CR=1 FL=1